MRGVATCFCYAITNCALRKKAKRLWRNAGAALLRHAGSQYLAGRLSSCAPAVLLASGRAPEQESRRLREFQENARYKQLAC